MYDITFISSKFEEIVDFIAKEDMKQLKDTRIRRIVRRKQMNSMHNFA